MPRRFILVLLVASVTGARAQSICAIQGSGTASPFNGQVVTTTGIVTGSYEGAAGLNGFFLEDPDCDALTSTSNGIFVYAPGVTNVGFGDVLQITAEVAEYQGCTELLNITSVSFLSTAAITPTDIFLPITMLSHWERYEGMLLRFPQTLVVTDNDSWVQYGELLLAPGRLWQATHATDPNDANVEGTTFTGNSNVAAINAAAYANTLSSIILDDGRVSSYPDPPPLLGPQGTLRCGSTVTDLTGVLHYSYGAYRVQPVGTVPLVHDVRPSLPVVGGDLLIGAMNLHNFWSTLGGFGAATSGELARQRTKLVAALEAMDADAFVLCELQDNDIAWVDLLDTLNAHVGAGTYAGVEDDGGFGTKPVIFYKTDVLSPVTPLYSISTSTFERTHITQGFEVLGSEARFLLSSMHLRSKLCDNATGPDLDQGDGQGCYNAHRREQAQELVDHWSSVRTITGIDAQLVMGDFNSYFQEDPLDLMRANGLTCQVPDEPANYSYRYASVIGAIDHAFGTSAMSGAITGAAPWAINSDEPSELDYPDANIDFYQPNAFRSSDHDPVLVGIDTDALVVGIGEEGTSANVAFQFDTEQEFARWEGEGIEHIEVLDAMGRVLIAVPPNQRTTGLSALPAGCYLWRCAMDAGRRAVTGRFVIR